jgi:hypothetical protein
MSARQCAAPSRRNGVEVDLAVASARRVTQSAPEWARVLVMPL